MFRDILRKKQQLSREECIEILKNELRGVLAVQGDNGYPYAFPINHYYCPEDGKLYFHGCHKGHKIDAMKANDKVSFCVYDQGEARDEDWSLYIKSVVVFGRVKFVSEPEKIVEISRNLSHKFTSDDEYIEKEIKQFAAATLCFELDPEHITGKLVHEA